jgi:hypothetical protein
LFVVAAAVGLGAFLSYYRASGQSDAASSAPRSSGEAASTLQQWVNGPGPAAMSRVGTDFTNIGDDDVAGDLSAAEQLCAASLADLHALNSTLPVADSQLNSDLENAIAYANTALVDCENADLNDEQTNSNDATHYIRAAEPLVRAGG